jgi:hypothetical protein
MKRFPLLAGLLIAVLTAGCQAPDPLKAPLLARFYLEARPGEPAIAQQMPISHVTINVGPKPVLLENDIIGAELVRVKLGWCMLVKFTPAAGRDLYRLSAGNLGRRLVLTFNDQPAGARRIDGVMGEGALLIFVEVDDVNLPPLVERLNRTSVDLLKHNR